MTEIINEVRKGFYLDSVALMRLSAEISGLEGIDEAVLMIGTPSNLQIMQDAGVLTSTGEAASPNDLIIALRAEGKASANRALAHANKSLEGGALKSTASAARARTLRSGHATHSDANLALISTPGSYAAREARVALELGLNVMIFSDNVSLEQEIALKSQAKQNNLLVMGPDCGTAYINGVPLAFANALNPLPASNKKTTTAVIAASGTGLQEFAVLLNRLGGELKHGIGVGGRDLSDAVGGISTLAAIDLLANDDSIDQIVLISKPPGPATAAQVFDKLASCGKPVITCVFGQSQNTIKGLRQTATLRDAAELASGESLGRTDTTNQAKQLISTLTGSRSKLKGLYTGGTLCTESQLLLKSAGLKTASNAPAPGSLSLENSSDAEHQILDLGADEYTVGRPHPMIEPQVRVSPFEEALNDSTVAVILLDVVLGYGAHDNPAQPVVDTMNSLATTNNDRPIVIASVCGTDSDPQGLQQQRAALIEGGIILCDCNSAAAELAAAIINQLP